MITAAHVKYSNCIRYNFFIFCPICMQFSHNILHTHSFILSIIKHNWKIRRFWVFDPLNSWLMKWLQIWSNSIHIYILWNLDWLRRRVVQFRIVMSASYMIHWDKKLSPFDRKSWVSGATKIWPGKVGKWRIFESNWLNIESQIDSTLRVELTQHWESNRLNIESQIGFWSLLMFYFFVNKVPQKKLAQHWESNWLNIGSQIEPTLIVKLIQHWESNWLNIDSQIDSNILKLPTLSSIILVLPVIQL